MEVKVYSTPTCPWCDKLKNFLKENNVKFKDINVAEDEEAADEMIEKSGQMGVPVLSIKKEEKEKILVGFDEGKIKNILEI